MTTCDSGYAQMHYFQIQLLISTERELHPLLKQISLWTAQVIISDHSNFLSWKGRTLEVVILKDAATLLDIALSQVQLLSAASSFPLLSTVPCTYHFTKGRSCIFTERPYIYIAPTPSTHQPLALLFCTTGRSCIFAEQSHSIYFCRKATAHAHFCRIVKTHICISLHCWTQRADEGKGSDDEEEEEPACHFEEGDHLSPPGRSEGLADMDKGARRF